MSKEIEFVDLVDKFGNIQVSKIDKTKIEKYPNLHLQIVIVVIFDKKGSILVQKRSLNKRIEPRYIDHICGAIKSGELPIDAAIRESIEETNTNPHDLKVIESKINSYGRYRYLLVGHSEDLPQNNDKNETEWVRFVPFTELVQKHISGEWKFVNEYFEDTRMAIENI